MEIEYHAFEWSVSYWRKKEENLKIPRSKWEWKDKISEYVGYMKGCSKKEVYKLWVPTFKKYKQDPKYTNDIPQGLRKTRTVQILTQ
jgi:hypothetical protein